MKTLLFWLVLCLPALAQSPAIRSVHGNILPQGGDATDILMFGHLYALAIEPQTKLARWCAFRLTASDFASRNVLSRNWVHTLPDVTLEASDYEKSGYDIGHLAPLGSFKASAYAWELNFTGNCAPQRPELNRGPWLRFEDHTRKLATEAEYVDVIVGTLYESPMEKLQNADEDHSVPSHFWAICTQKGGKTEAFLLPQDCSRNAELGNFVVPIEDIERRTGLIIR